MVGKAQGNAYFASWLDTTMENQGVTNRDLATQVGVHESVTSRWRSGRGAPSMDNARKLAEVFSVDFLQLAVTAGLIDGSAVHTEPLPLPAPDALRERLRHDLSKVKGVTNAVIEAALRAWDEEIGAEQ